jgi:hypothetical protein
MKRMLMVLVNQFAIGLAPHTWNTLIGTTAPCNLFQYWYLNMPMLPAALEKCRCRAVNTQSVSRLSERSGISV